MGFKHIEKKCGDCKEWKPVSEFYPSPRRSDCRDGYCKSCRRRRDRARSANRSKAVLAKKAKDPLHYRRQKLLKLYGITHEQYMEMHEAQGGVCAICGQEEKRVLYGAVSHLVVDHNHATGKVRGLLCHACNHRLGIIEDEQFCLLAHEYLWKTDRYEFLNITEVAKRRAEVVH